MRKAIIVRIPVLPIGGDIIFRKENRKRAARLIFWQFRVASSSLQIDVTLKNKGAVFAFP